MKDEFTSTPESNTHRIRKFELQDAQAVEQLLRNSPGATPWSLDSIKYANQTGQIAWVIEIDQAVRGFLAACTIATEAEILNLCVDSQNRRTGHASSLLQAALTEFQHLRVKSIFLEVRETNHAAISFYEKHAFSSTGRRRAYYTDPTEDAVLMRKELNG
jgi:ribosomal-protein-alanine N-acetyltransferase